MWLNNSILIKSYLGDQDSNVYKTIKSTKYGSYITKIDCSNHINRNFINKIENWKKDKTNQIPKGICNKRWRGEFISVFSLLIREKSSDTQYFKEHIKNIF